jgi:hypothetical protein
VCEAFEGGEEESSLVAELEFNYKWAKKRERE